LKKKCYHCNRNRICKMKKIKYLFLIIGSIVFFIACTKQAQITGPAGPAGVQGVPGGNVYGTTISASLNASYFAGAGPIYNWYTVFSGYNPTLSYDLVVYGHKAIAPLNKEQYRLPWYNVYNTGDELISSMVHDTINIWYVSGTPWPTVTDSTVQLQLLVLPQQK
jgi:hypothetical protein